MKGEKQEGEKQSVERAEVKKRKTETSVEVRTNSPIMISCINRCCEKPANIRDETSCRFYKAHENHKISQKIKIKKIKVDARSADIYYRYVSIYRVRRGEAGGRQEGGKPDWLLRLQREHLWHMLWLQTQWLE